MSKRKDTRRSVLAAFWASVLMVAALTCGVVSPAYASNPDDVTNAAVEAFAVNVEPADGASSDEASAKGDLAIDAGSAVETDAPKTAESPDDVDAEGAAAAEGDSEDAANSTGASADEGVGDASEAPGAEVPNASDVLEPEKSLDASEPKNAGDSDKPESVSPAKPANDASADSANVPVESAKIADGVREKSVADDELGSDSVVHAPKEKASANSYHALPSNGSDVDQPNSALANDDAHVANDAAADIPSNPKTTYAKETYRAVESETLPESEARVEAEGEIALKKAPVAEDESEPGVHASSSERSVAPEKSDERTSDSVQESGGATPQLAFGVQVWVAPAEATLSATEYEAGEEVCADPQETSEEGAPALTLPFSLRFGGGHGPYIPDVAEINMRRTEYAPPTFQSCLIQVVQGVYRLEVRHFAESEDANKGVLLFEKARCRSP